MVELVDTSVLEADAERRASSSLALGTKCECGEIGRHKRLKISRRKACRFDSGHSYQLWNK